jgi:MFS family permease
MTMSTQVPEPFANPALLEQPTGSFPAVRSRTSSRRLGLGFFIIGFAWLFAQQLALSTALAVKIQILVPDEKVFYLGLTTAIAGVGTTLSIFVWGTISDLTRSRFGRRTPWIIFGGTAGVIGVILVGLSTTIGTLVAAYVGYGLLFNALTAAVVAIFPDRIPREKRGTFSAIYGGAGVIGSGIAGIIAAQFLKDPTPLFFAGAVVLALGTVLFVFIAPDFSSKDEPRAKLDLRGVLASFKFPARAPDFYWAFAGRFMLLLGLFMVQNFSLYILTDYIHLTKDEAQPVLTISGLLSLVSIIAGTFFGGWISDKIKRRKLPIFVSSLFFGIAVLLPFVWPTGTSMIIFGGVAGLGLGAFLSVDTALMTEVLPSEASRGKDMGILSTANTVPNIIAPLATAAIVGVAGYGPVFLVALVIIVVGAFSIFKIKGVR